MMRRQFFVDSSTTFKRRYNPYLTPRKYIPNIYQRQGYFNFSSGLDETAVTIDSIKNERSQIYKKVVCRTDFAKLGPVPNLKLVSSKTSIIPLSDPMNAVYNETYNQWVVADRYKGIVCISQDVSHILHTYYVPSLKRPSAVILLNDGNCAGVLDDNGIHVLDFKTGEFKLIYRINRCRGLGMTFMDDFVTFDTDRGQLLIIPQDGSDTISRDYSFRQNKNIEDQPSRVSFIGVSDRRIWLTDYTLGVVTVFRFDPIKRCFIDETTIDCTLDVAQCRLTGCFVDAYGRAVVANCKERILKHFDHDGRELTDINVDDGFCRSGGIYVNSNFQTLVIDLHSQPPSVRLYRLVNVERNLNTPYKEQILTPLKDVKPNLQDPRLLLNTPTKRSLLNTPTKENMYYNQKSVIMTPERRRTLEEIVALSSTMHII